MAWCIILTETCCYNQFSFAVIMLCFIVRILLYIYIFYHIALDVSLFLHLNWQYNHCTVIFIVLVKMIVIS